MKFTVYITQPAEDDLDRVYEWLAGQTEQHAPTWHDGLVDAILSLEKMPSRCPLAPEARHAKQIRQLLYGTPPHLYRILFLVRGDQVLILHIRHGARRRWRSR
jgi:plasmid stabilization system protein ParE